MWFKDLQLAFFKCFVKHVSVKMYHVNQPAMPIEAEINAWSHFFVYSAD